MDGTTNHVVRSANNSGGDSSTSPTGRMVGSVGEEVVFTTAASAGSVARAGWSELHAFPGKVQDLGGTNILFSSASLRWTTPAYDGGDGTLQVGSTYYIRIATYTVPDTFSDPRLANISFSTNGVIPGELVSVDLLGLLPGSTYFARIWTTDGDSNLAYDSNIASFSLAGVSAPSGGSITATFISSITATWAASLGAQNYLLVGSTMTSFVPVAASSLTVASTGTISGLDPNTTYYLGVAACPGCSAFTVLGSTLTRAAPAVGLSTTAISSSTINLAWGANGNPAGTRYVVRLSTDNVAFVSVATVTAVTAQLAGLTNDTTYYLTVVSLNNDGLAAPPSNLLTVVTPIGPVPFAPTGVSATAVILGARVAWSALPPGGDGVGLLYYRVSRSTNAGFGFVSVTTTTALTYQERPLTLGPTYYYKISARDVGQVEGPFSATVGALPFTLTPMEPLGIHVVPAPLSVTLSWSTTTRFGDGTPFISTSAPITDELIGYSIYKSSEPCGASTVVISSLPFNVTSTVSVTGGQNFFYQIYSYNSLGLSSNAVTLSSLGERNFFLEDCLSRVVFDAATSALLNADGNGVGDIRIDRRRIDEDVHDSVFQSVKFTPMLNGVTELRNYPMPKPVRIVLGFQTSGGQAVSPSAVPSAAVAVKNLGMYWFTGAEFKKMYGTVDPVTQTVTVESPNLGVYQIRALARADSTVFDVSNISGRAITPNGDGLNDTVIFTYDPGPNNETPTGAIYDVLGSFVANMSPGALVPNTLTWDGRSNGRVVGSGVYVYRLRGGGKTYTGTIAVVR